MLQRVPVSQKDRPIAFALLDGGAPIAWHELIVRPESLTRVEPQRVMVHNTLGGAYIDAFGRGVGQVILEGTTGWRGAEVAFHSLRETIGAWDALRQSRLSMALSPDDVELVLSDALDEFALVVVPQEFTLNRTKAPNPLLFRYRIRMAVARDLADPGPMDLDAILKALTDALGRAAAALGSLTGIAGLQGVAASALGALGKALGALAKAGQVFLQTSQRLLTAVVSGVNAVTGVVDAVLKPVYYLALATQLAGRNLFYAASSLTGMPAHVVYQLNRIGTLFESARCNLLLGFDQMQSIFDLEPLFGASHCSSTAGGRPPSLYAGADHNVFASIAPAGGSLLQTTASAQAMRMAGTIDPLVTQFSPSYAAGLMQTMTDGIHLP